MTILNLYMDAEVPVSLAMSVTVVKAGEDVVVATGTWTRQGKTEDEAMGFPIQTSRIECRKSEGRCVESRATVARSTLTTGLVVYEIQTWGESFVVFASEGLCSAEVYTIDLAAQAVNGAGRSTNQASVYCARNPIKEVRWTYRLEDGFKIYWEERKKARPMLLRVIQAIFGN